jgi:sulfite exporter TauE/SafE
MIVATMTALDITLPLGLGLAASLHCAQMCGPIVFCVTQSGRPVAGQIAYNTGRIFTYAALGAVAGGVGSGVTRLAGVEQTAAIVAGAFMILAGALMVGASRRTLVQIERWRMPRALTRSIGRLLLAPGAGRRLGLGALMGFLPCGLIYAALLKAAAAGSPGAGAVSMAAFGLGTAVSLFAAGLFSGAIRARLGRWSGAVAAAAVIGMGMFLVWRGVMARVPGMNCHAGL